MKPDKVGVGLIGTGFARTAQAPALRACEGAQLVAVCSGNYANAEKTAQEFDIKFVCRDEQELLKLDEVDLVIIATPPVFHRQMTLDALAHGKHVICEKPMAMNATEAAEMLTAAQAHTHQLAIIDHELRFNPTWRRLKELLEEDHVGAIQHVSMTIAAGFRHSALRPWNWWSQTAMGGGLLGALGSHALDALRWLFGEITIIGSDVATLVTERKDATTGEMKRNETDDYVTCLLHLRQSDGRIVRGQLLLSGHYASGGKNNLTIVGTNGTIILDGDETLTAAPGFNVPFEDYSLIDRAREIAWLPDNLWARSFYHLARETVQAIHENRTDIPHAATFADGLACQQAMDAIRKKNERMRE